MFIIPFHYCKRKGGGSANSQPPSPPTNGPYPSSREPNNWRRTMSFSHPKKNPSTVTVAGLSGPQALRDFFNPRQVLRLKEAAQVLNYSYSHFFRRIQAGTLSLRIRKNEVGERYVLLDDLISYLFPPEESTSSPMPAKRKPGRPRTLTSDGCGKGGGK